MSRKEPSSILKSSNLTAIKRVKITKTIRLNAPRDWVRKQAHSNGIESSGRYYVVLIADQTTGCRRSTQRLMLLNSLFVPTFETIVLRLLRNKFVAFTYFVYGQIDWQNEDSGIKNHE